MAHKSPKVKEISPTEHGWLSLCLAQYAGKIFSDMWQSQRRLVFTDEYDHAALELEGGGFRINANPRHWKKLSDKAKCFIIVHECLHVLFGHWVSPENEDREWANVAQDIHVNEYIKKNYPALTPNPKEQKGQAWVDSVFKEQARLVKRDQDYKYYYGLLMKCLA